MVGDECAARPTCHRSRDLHARSPRSAERAARDCARARGPRGPRTTRRTHRQPDAGIISAVHKPLPRAFEPDGRGLIVASAAEPGRDCPLCPRLAFRKQAARRSRLAQCAVPSFGACDARLLIVGLAPGLREPIEPAALTGDYSGTLLYETLINPVCAWQATMAAR